MKITLNDIIQVAAICAVALIVYACLDVQEEVTPEWTESVKIQERIDFESLMYHDGKLWLVYTKGPARDEDVLITQSEDGINWSSPCIFFDETPDSSFGNPMWLKRPNDEVWLVGSSDLRDDGYLDIVYVQLEEYGTWSTPHAIYSYYIRDYHLKSISTTPDGGIIILMEYWPVYHTTIDGREVTARAYTFCVIQTADENMQWNPQITLSETKFTSAYYLYLDNEKTIWAIYEESRPKEGIYCRTSEDGTSWSEPHLITKRDGRVTSFLQRRNGEYFLFFIDNHSAYMMTSRDGLTWSQHELIFEMGEPCEIVKTEFGDVPIWGPDNVFAAESEDGTMWVLVDTDCCYYSMQYAEDSQTTKTYRIKNGALACGVGIAVGVAWFTLRKKVLT